jgi:hypothetical protein
MATFIEGYLATITLDAVAYHPYSSDATLGLTRDAVDKTKLGEDRRTYISGLGDGTIDATLHLATEFAVAVQTAYDKTTPLAYLFRPGALGTKDAGQYEGGAIITDFSQAGAADGEWDVTLTLQLTGQYTYTAPV